MARIPGTETPTNRAGWRAGDAVRGRRARAAAAQGIADRRGLVTEVRSGHVRVVFETGRQGLWLGNGLMVAVDDVGNPDLDLMRGVMRALGAVRLEFDEGDLLTMYCTEVAEGALNEVRALLGTRLAAIDIAPEGVHELAVHLHVRLKRD